MEATASVTPGATIGMPVIACQYPVKSAWVTWIVHHALRSCHWSIATKTQKKNPPAKQITRTPEFQKRSSWAIMAISLAFAVILLGGAFWSDPYRQMKASMAFSFRLPDANLCSKSSADSGLLPKDKQWPSSASITFNVAVGIKDPNTIYPHS